MASKETDVARLTRFSARFLPALKEPWQVNGAGPTAGLGVARAPSNGGYIAGPWYDNIFFIFSPLIALALGSSAPIVPVLVVFAALPTASAAHVLAAGFGADRKLAATLIAQTTILSAATLPVWMTVAEWLANR